MQISSKQLTVNLNEHTGDIYGIFNYNDNHQLLQNSQAPCRLIIDGKDIIEECSVTVKKYNEQTASIVYQTPQAFGYNLQVVITLTISHYYLSIDSQVINLDQSDCHYCLEVLTPINANVNDISNIKVNGDNISYMLQPININNPVNFRLFTYRYQLAYTKSYGFNNLSIVDSDKRCYFIYQQYNNLNPNSQNSGKLIVDFKILSKSVKRRRIIGWFLLLLTILSLGMLYFNTTLKYQLFYRQVVNGFDGEINTQYMEESIYSGIIRGLNNPYSKYLTDEEFGQMQNSINMFGLAIAPNEYNYLMVRDISPNSPASNQDILPGDYVTKINDQPLSANSYNLFTTITSNNDTINIELYRPSTNETINCSITKDKIPGPQIIVKNYEQNGTKFGYIKIPRFEEEVAKQFANALDQFKQTGIDQLIIDVCDNPGGDVKVVNEILNQLVVSDKPIFTFTNHGKVKEQYFSELKEQPNFKINVLQNGSSASASEILSLVLKEYADANIVGTTSYGKGTGQSITKNMYGPGYIKETTFHWQSGKGTSIDGVGVEPTTKLDQPVDSIDYIFLTDQLTLNSSGFNAYLVNKYLYYCGYDVDYQSNVLNPKSINAINQFATDNGLSATSSVAPKIAYELTKQAQVKYYEPQFDPALKVVIESV